MEKDYPIVRLVIRGRYQEKYSGICYAKIIDKIVSTNTEAQVERPDTSYQKQPAEDQSKVVKHDNDGAVAESQVEKPITGHGNNIGVLANQFDKSLNVSDKEPQDTKNKAVGYDNDHDAAKPQNDRKSVSYDSGTSTTRHEDMEKINTPEQKIEKPESVNSAFLLCDIITEKDDEAEDETEVGAQSQNQPTSPGFALFKQKGTLVLCPNDENWEEVKKIAPAKKPEVITDEALLRELYLSPRKTLETFIMLRNEPENVRKVRELSAILQRINYALTDEEPVAGPSGVKSDVQK